MNKVKKFYYFLFLIEILMLSINSVDGGDVTIDSEGNVYVDGKLDEKADIYLIYNSSLDNITPNYQITPIVDKRTINGGEGFTISYQISGNGKVVSNKLITYFPKELLKDNPTYYWYISEAIENDTTKGVLWLDKYPFVRVGSKEGALISLVDVVFMQSVPDINKIVGEDIINGHRPIKIKAISSENAPPGNHVIKINFVYSDGESWYSSQDEVTIHINSWAEQNEWLINITVPFSTTFIGALLGFLGAFYLSNKWQKWRSTKENNIHSKTLHANNRTNNKPSNKEIKKEKQDK